MCWSFAVTVFFLFSAFAVKINLSGNGRGDRQKIRPLYSLVTAKQLPLPLRLVFTAKKLRNARLKKCFCGIP